MQQRLYPLLFLCVFAVGSLAAQEQIDTAAISAIKMEGIERSRVMDILWHLTDRYGPRLPNSPEYKGAAAWAKKEMESWGVENVRYDNFYFGRGWSLKKFSASMVSPVTFPIIGYPKAWSPSLRKPITADVVHVRPKSEEELQSLRGKLKGKIVLLGEPRAIEPSFTPLATRVSDSSLLLMANADTAPSRRRRAPQGDTAAFRRFMQSQNLQLKTMAFIREEGAVAVFDRSDLDAHNLRVFNASTMQGPDTPPNDRVSSFHPKAPAFLPQITISAEHFNRMARLLERGNALRIELDLQTEYFTGTDSCYNIIGEIPGADLKDEIVMVGGHFDSWHAATGATDNAAGSAVAMEALRIIKASGLKPRRTIRIGLWGAEEQGLIGSRSYVAKHLAERTQATPTASANTNRKPEYGKFVAYFNHDNGSGQFRGIYMQGNEALRPIFRAWLKPFAPWGASTLTLSNTGSTDHIAFDAVGLNGFQFIQDPLEYFTRTWHTSLDVYDRAVEQDLKRNATIMAAFAYLAAMRDEPLPRKPQAE